MEVAEDLAPGVCSSPSIKTDAKKNPLREEGFLLSEDPGYTFGITTVSIT